MSEMCSKRLRKMVGQKRKSHTIASERCSMEGFAGSEGDEEDALFLLSRFVLAAGAKIVAASDGP